MRLCIQNNNRYRDLMPSISQISRLRSDYIKEIDIKLRQNLVDKPGKSDILNLYEKKPCEITALFSHGFLENQG